MSIIPCPDCGKKVSDKAVICRNCGFQLGDATEEDFEIFRARKLRDRIYRLNMVSYLVITLFILGFGWYWIDSEGFTTMSSAGPFIVMGLMAVAYIVVRGFLFQARSKQKAMRQKLKMSADLRRNL
jgi:hypothetical protein